MATPEEVKTLDRRYREGGMGYGEAKERLFEVVERVLGPARERREKLVADPGYVEDILAAGAAKAGAVAREVMADARDACGIVIMKGSQR